MTLDTYGALTEPATFQIQRLLPGPLDRVWAYLTDATLRRQWLADGAMPTGVGEPFELTWRNDELTDPPGFNPNGLQGVQSMQSAITALDPNRTLSITWGRTGGVTFSLEPKGSEVLLTVTHHRLADRSMLLSISAGWHAHLNILAARLAGHAPEPFWDAIGRLTPEYKARLAA
jgi:uncharacterized protein YndB with AHSA1/START domain